MPKHYILENLLSSLNTEFSVQNLTSLQFLQRTLFLKVQINCAYTVQTHAGADTGDSILSKKWNNMESRETIKNRFYDGTVGEKVKSREMYAGIC